MPYGGVSWTRFLSFGTAAIFSMFLGAQSVHLVYRPLDDLDYYVDQQKEMVKNDEKLLAFIESRRKGQKPLKEKEDIENWN